MFLSVLFDWLLKGKINQGMMEKETNMPASIQQPPPLTPQKNIRMPFWQKLLARLKKRLMKQLKRMIQTQKA